MLTSFNSSAVIYPSLSKSNLSNAATHCFSHAVEPSPSSWRMCTAAAANSSKSTRPSLFVSIWASKKAKKREAWCTWIEVGYMNPFREEGICASRHTALRTSTTFDSWPCHVLSFVRAWHIHKTHTIDLSMSINTCSNSKWHNHKLPLMESKVLASLKSF